MAGCGWFVGGMRREDCDGWVEAAPATGQFLVRRSRSGAPGSYVVAVHAGGVAHSVQVAISESGQFRFAERWFKDVPTVIKFWQEHSFRQARRTAP